MIFLSTSEIRLQCQCGIQMHSRAHLLIERDGERLEKDKPWVGIHLYELHALIHIFLICILYIKS